MLRARADIERGFDQGPSEAAGEGVRGNVCGSRRTQLFLQGLPLLLRLGWTPEERALARTVWVELILDVSYDGSGELSATVDLYEVVNVVKTLSDQEFRLVEDVAELLADRLLAAFDLLQRVRVEIRKPNPPAGFVVAATGAVVERGRDG